MSFFILHTLFSIICSLSSQASYFLKGRERGEDMNAQASNKKFALSNSILLLSAPKTDQITNIFSKGEQNKKVAERAPQSFFSCEKIQYIKLVYGLIICSLYQRSVLYLLGFQIGSENIYFICRIFFQNTRLRYNSEMIRLLGWLKFLSPFSLVLKFALKKPISHLMAYFSVEMGVLEEH